jgi:hypothetical protein
MAELTWLSPVLAVVLKVSKCPTALGLSLGTWRVWWRRKSTAVVEIRSLESQLGFGVEHCRAFAMALSLVDVASKNRMILKEEIWGPHVPRSGTSAIQISMRCLGKRRRCVCAAMATAIWGTWRSVPFRATARETWAPRERRHAASALDPCDLVGPAIYLSFEPYQRTSYMPGDAAVGLRCGSENLDGGSVCLSRKPPSTAKQARADPR